MRAIRAERPPQAGEMIRGIISSDKRPERKRRAGKPRLFALPLARARGVRPLS